MLRRGCSLLLSRRGPLCAPVRRRLCDKSPSSPIELDLVRRAKDLGLPPLSLSERSLIAREADALGDADGRLSESDWALLVSRRARAEQERLTISEYLAKSHDQHLGQHGLKLLSRMGITFFALCGGHTAGEAGMHWAGATVVGCVTGLGGGTINNVMMGSTPVGWMRDPPILLSAVAAALAGFYLWPLAERFFEADGATDTTGAAGSVKSAASTTSAVRYALESVALGSLAVVGAQSAIARGLHPVVCACAGVIMPFGGVLRDVICQRPVTLGSHSGCQSYAIASLSASTVYVALRQAHVWNCAGDTAKLVHGGIPISLRIACGLGAAIAFRAAAWQAGKDELFDSMDVRADANVQSLRQLLAAPGGA